MSEANLERWVRNRAKKRGIESIKMALRWDSGWPDVLFLVPGGTPTFIEFKSPGNKPTPLQKVKIGILQKSGYRVHVCDNKDEALEVLGLGSS